MKKGAWALPTIFGSLTGAIGWVAFCVFVLDEWERKFGRGWSFVLGAAFLGLVALYMAIAGLLQDVLLEAIGRERLRGWSAFVVCALGPPFCDGVWRVWRPGAHADWRFWALLLGVPAGVALFLRVLFAPRALPPEAGAVAV